MIFADWLHSGTACSIVALQQMFWVGFLLFCMEFAGSLQVLQFYLRSPKPWVLTCISKFPLGLFVCACMVTWVALWLIGDPSMVYLTFYPQTAGDIQKDQVIWLIISGFKAKKPLLMLHYSFFWVIQKQSLARGDMSNPPLDSLSCVLLRL